MCIAKKAKIIKETDLLCSSDHDDFLSEKVNSFVPHSNSEVNRRLRKSQRLKIVDV